MKYDIFHAVIPDLPQQPFRNGVGAWEGVVAHATASYAPDENEVAYMTRLWLEFRAAGSPAGQDPAFVQFFVDWDSIRQTAPTEYKAYGAGRFANQRYIHVELCQTKDPARFSASYARYVWLLAWLLHSKKLGVIDGVTLVSHNWVTKNLGGTNHTDPDGYLAEWGYTWEDVVRDVEKEYKELEEQPMTTAEKQAFEELKALAERQAEQLQALEAKRNMPCPDWAQKAYDFYKPYMDTPTGSYDFWRSLVIQYRKERGLKV